MHPKLLISRERTNEIFCHCGIRAGATAFHFHSPIELYLVEDGEVEVWINQQHKRLRGGQMAVTLSYDAHQYEPVGSATITYLIVPAHLCSELDGLHAGNPFIEDPALFGKIHQCCEVISQRRNPLLTDGCIRAAFGLLLESLPFTQRDSAVAPDQMAAVLIYLQEHFKSSLSLSSAAAALGMNASYLSRQFKSTLGVGFHQYLKLLRLREAVLHLSNGHSADFCAYESGFNSLRTFYRAFSEEFGCTPKEYFKTIRE